MLITLVFGLFIFLISFVVPRFAQLYDQIGSKLPAITLALLAVGNVRSEICSLCASGAGSLVYLLYRWSKTEAGADRIDRIRIKLPVFGTIWLKYQVALFSRTLSTLLSGGLPLVPSLETAARSISSRRISQAVFSSVVSVREGQGLSASLEGTKVFPALSVEMIEVGESTGALPQMLNSVAEFFEEDVQTALTAAMSLIEPAILIVMGGMVVVILIAFTFHCFQWPTQATSAEDWPSRQLLRVATPVGRGARDWGSGRSGKWD